MKFKSGIGWLLFSALASAPMFSVVSAAETATSAEDKTGATAGANTDTLDEITVTVNRRVERLEDVPVSVAAASGQSLEDLNIRRPEELVRLFPGFTAITNAGSAAVSYNIRGVGQSDFSEHEEQPVTAYQDGVYIANSAATGFPLFDQQRVELLRGPQGTLFGRNATGGLVQFFSNQPTAGEEGYTTLGTGDYNLQRIESGYNYGNDTFATRIATYFSDRDGFVKNTLGRNLLAEEVGALRLQMRWTPSEQTTATLRLEGFNSLGTSENKATPSAVASKGSPYAPTGMSYLIPPNVNVYGTGPGKDFYGYRDNPNPYVESVNDAGTIQKFSRTAALTLQQKLTDTLTLHSLTSWNQANEQYREDTDGTPNYVFYNKDVTHTHTISQELRLESSAPTVRWTAGVYALDIDGTYFIANGVPTICDPTNTVTCVYAGTLPLNAVDGKGAESGSNYKLETKSIAGFAQAEKDLTDQLTFIIGGRFTHDTNEFNYSYYCTQTEAGACTAIFGTGIPTSVKYLGPGPFHLSQGHGLPSGKIGLNFKVTPDMLAYVSVNRGVKGAGYIYSYDGNLPLSQLSFRPEKLTSVEGGLKAQWFDHIFTTNIAVFHYDYHDFQTFFLSGVSATVVNKEATANGGELELALTPGDGWRANLGIAYDNMWVKGIPTFAGMIQDQRPINAPVWQGNWGLSKAWVLPNESTLRLQYDGRFTGERWFNIVNEAVVRSPSDTIHGVDLTLETSAHVSTQAYVTNLTNVAVANARFDQTGQGFVLAHYSPPRMFGLSVTYKY
jgi:iron complex outermembrane receptor protein